MEEARDPDEPRWSPGSPRRGGQAAGGKARGNGYLQHPLGQRVHESPRRTADLLRGDGFSGASGPREVPTGRAQALPIRLGDSRSRSERTAHRRGRSGGRPLRWQLGCRGAHRRTPLRIRYAPRPHRLGHSPSSVHPQDPDGRTTGSPRFARRMGSRPSCAATVEYDVFGAGHAATSISAALGMATDETSGRDFNVVAVIGDGAMGLRAGLRSAHNAGHTDRDFIVILNDNDMSIAPNVGAMNKYLNGVITKPALQPHPREREGPVAQGADHARRCDGIGGGQVRRQRQAHVRPGHDLRRARVPLHRAGGRSRTSTRWSTPSKGCATCPVRCSLHLVTQKGKGYEPSEEDPVKWHAPKSVGQITGLSPQSSGGLPKYQAIFGKGLTELAAGDSRVAAITAAMPGGTSADIFGKAFPEEVLRRGHRRSPRRHFGGGHGHRRHSASRSHLFDVPPTRVRLDRPRRRRCKICP